MPARDDTGFLTSAAHATSVESTARFSGLDLLTVLYRRKWLVLGLTTALTAVDFAAATALPKIYRAQVLLQLEMQGNVTPGGEVRGIPADLDGGAMQSQEEVIRTPPIAVKVIKEAKLKDSPEFLAAFSSDPWWADLKTRLTSMLPGGDKGFINSFLRNQPRDPDELARIQREEEIRIFEDHLDVSFDQRGTSLRIAYRSQDPAIAAAAANATARFYVDQQIESKTAMLSEAGSWLSERIAELRRAAETSETDLARFRAEHHLGTDQTPAFTQQRLSDLNKQLITALGEQFAATSRLEEAQRAEKAGGAVAVSNVLDSKAIQNLRAEEIRAQIAFTDAKSKGNLILVDREAAVLVAVRIQLQDEAHRIIASLGHDVGAAVFRVVQIQRAIADITAEAAKREPAYAQAEAFTREATANRAVFDGVVRKTEEIRTMNGLQHPDIQVVSQAFVPALPYFPRLRLFLPIGAVGGFLMSSALALFIERRQRGIRSIDAGERILGMPGLGWLPSIHSRGSKRHQIAMISPMPQLLRDSLWMLALSLCSLAERQRPVILISSTISGEGKTTTAVWLARTFARSGKSCLLIDADRRRPAASFYLNAEEGHPGLDDVIAGRQSLEGAVTLHPETGVFLLSALNTNEIPTYDSSALAKTVAAARSQYEVVIIDTPPVLAAPDSFAFAPHADLLLMVVQQGKAPARLVAKAARRLAAYWGDSNVGFILSRAHPASFRSADVESYSMGYLKRPEYSGVRAVQEIPK
jgi:succinoglycan biosynthesis transport protein ExoP